MSRQLGARLASREEAEEKQMLVNSTQGLERLATYSPFFTLPFSLQCRALLISRRDGAFRALAQQLVPQVNDRQALTAEATSFHPKVRKKKSGP